MTISSRQPAPTRDEWVAQLLRPERQRNAILSGVPTARDTLFLGAKRLVVDNVDLLAKLAELEDRIAAMEVRLPVS